MLEVYNDSIWISGSVDHSGNATYALYAGLAGLAGAKIIDLTPQINPGNNIASFLSGQNKLANTPGLLNLIQNREIYFASDNNENLRGQVLPEIRSAFYANLSGIKTVDISNSIAHGRACLLYTSPSPRDKRQSRMPSSA